MNTDPEHTRRRWRERIARPTLFVVGILAFMLAAWSALALTNDGPGAAESSEVATVAPSTEPPASAITTTIDAEAVAEYVGVVQEAEALQFVAGWDQAEQDEAARVAEEARIAEEARRAAATTTAPPAPAPAPAPPVVTAGGWGACAIPQYICDRESGDDPTTNTGNGYFGRYQFAPGTWDGQVARMGRPDLIGNYMPDGATQDLVAASLWAGGAGCGHWNAC